jgi:hypothetical protein
MHNTSLACGAPRNVKILWQPSTLISLRSPQGTQRSHHYTRLQPEPVTGANSTSTAGSSDCESGVPPCSCCSDHRHRTAPCDNSGGRRPAKRPHPVPCRTCRSRDVPASAADKFVSFSSPPRPLVQWPAAEERPTGRSPSLLTPVPAHCGGRSGPTVARHGPGRDVGRLLPLRCGSAPCLHPSGRQHADTLCQTLELTRGLVGQGE